MSLASPSHRRVGLVVETSNAYSRGLIRGVMKYAHERGWSLWLAESERGHAPAALRHWDGDGLIARVENARVARAVVATKKPIVDVSSARLLPSVPWVETDDDAIAKIAFEHLRDLGLTHFGYAGDDHFNWSRWRQASFVRTVAAAGYECSVCPAVNREKWVPQRDRTAKWLEGLPRPVGIFSCYDPRAREVLDACQAAGLRVPDEVAVLGVDNDELLCDLAEPPLSSVAPNAVRTGAVAAGLLDRLMAGDKLPGIPHLIPPLEVVARQSTDLLAVDDADVAAALRFIRANACSGIGVTEVLRHVPLSRRALESRFVKLLGRTPHEEIVRRQMERVKILLSKSDDRLIEIAHRAGFATAEYMSVSFKKATGMTLREFRLSSRADKFYGD